MPKIEVELKEIPSETPIRLESDGTGIVVVRSNGTVQAFFDRCPHAHWPLSEGELRDGILHCIGHGWEFDTATGQCLTVPTCRLQPLPVVVEKDRVQIEWE